MTAETLRNIVAAGCGYVPPDGSEHTCGDVNGSGLQCSMYAAARRRCTILGKRIEITPSMTCIHDITGPPPAESATIMELATAREVGLTETREGATCKRCDHSGGAACVLLSAIMEALAERFGVAASVFGIAPDACCDFWRREGVEVLA